MEEKLIEYPTAKLAKEKGFSIPNNTLSYEYFTDGTLSKFGNIKQHYSEAIVKNKVISCTAVTQSLLSKWLREIHGIHVTVYWNGDKNYDWSIKTDPSKILNHVQHYDSYEDALENALVESLNMIK